MHPIWRPPRLHQASEMSEERRVTWLELFYDLVYVASLILLGNRLSEDVSIIGLLKFVILFLPIWWAWTGITFYINRFVVDDLWHRGLIFLQICAIAWLGVSLEGAFSHLAAQFALTYAVIRLIIILLYLRTWRHVPQTRPLIQRYIVAHSAGVVLWSISAFVPAPVNYSLWLLALSIEIGNAFLPKTRHLQVLLPPDPPHLAERYGIFTIIVLGESFIKTITASSGTALNLSAFTFGILGIWVTFSLWWLYFDDVAEATIKPTHFAPYVWIYTHLPLSISLIIFGVASKKLFLSVEKGHLDQKYVLLFCTALILYSLALAALNYVTQPHHKGLPTKTHVYMHLGSIIPFVLLAFIGPQLSPVIFIAIVAVIQLSHIIWKVSVSR